MKYQIVLLTLVLIIIASYVFGSKYLDSQIEPAPEYEGDPGQVIELPNLGGIVSESTVDWGLYSTYDNLLMDYTVGNKTYEEFLANILSILENTSEIYPSALPYMLKAIPLDPQSRYKLYLQDSLNRSETAIFCVESSSPQNKVSIIFRGEFVYDVIVQDESTVQVMAEGGQYSIRFYKNTSKN